MYVSVPATSGNLGPGFDVLGMAFDWRMEARATFSDTWNIRVTGPAAGKLPSDDTNLMAVVYSAFCRDNGWPVRPLSIDMQSPLPLCGGLGSSATAIVGALALAFLANDQPVDRDRIFAEAARREGHPDNAAPAIFGGLQVCGSSSGFETRSAPVHESIGAVLVVLEAQASTEEMRQVLPKTWPDEDLAENKKLVARLLKGLETGDPEGLACSERDRIHQPYRFQAQPLSKQVFELMCGVPEIAGAFLGGSGPTVIGWVTEGQRPDVAGVLEAAGIPAQIRDVAVDRDGLIWQKT